ncbi:hypothetical protein HGRIS_007933 [Hohenbuehelia grisea]|uniref:Inner centromere protein ARK-binding domain-containing protein n=1 Tax=Hohenbuehelia grisea TaxID=104357 RepID=A0ABR3J6U1_9AGAR
MNVAQQPGLLKWANSVRLTMAGDPGRQFFKDHIQQHGFLFLEDYLGDIVAGPRQDPIIDLVKTPGRKKAAAKKSKPVASRLNNVISLSLEDDTPKENQAPVNTFHQTLLAAKEEKTGDEDGRQTEHSRPPLRDDQNCVRSNEPHTTVSPLPSAPELRFNSQDINAVVSAGEAHVSQAVDIASDTLALPVERSEQNELSVIVEGDEPLPSEEHTALLSPPSKPSEVEEKPLLREDPLQDVRESLQSTTYSSTSSVNTFHSIPLDSPMTETAPFHSASSSVTAHGHMSVPHTDHDDDEVETPHTVDTEFDTIFRHLPNDSADLITSNTPPSEFDVPIQDEPADTKPAHELTRKPSMPSYPSLPAPAPLRKSMRAPRDGSVVAPPSLGAATPGAAAGGKRTSWLAKAREVKALEDVGKRFTHGPGVATAAASALAMPNPFPPLAPATKRKSSEMLGSHGEFAWEEEQRVTKVTKITEDPFVLPKQAPEVKGKERDELPQSVPLAEPAPSPAASAQAGSTTRSDEGIFGLLKKTVGGFGLRAGKSMGKSLGGGQAALGLAEARKAAEAKIAERDRHIEEQAAATDVDSKAQFESERKSLEQKDVARPVPSRPSQVSYTSESDRRMSLSDLFTGKELLVGDKGKDAALAKNVRSTPPRTSNSIDFGNDSISTTPPNSPPASRPTSLSTQPVPVFTKPPPVFVPPAPSTKPPSATTPAVPSKVLSSIFSKPAPKAFGLPTTLHPPSPPPRSVAQLSAQSTMESVMSEPMFDSQEPPAWMPDTQDTEYTQQSQADCLDPIARINQLDEDDDSWPMDEKIAAAAQWNADINAKEDSLTWSTLPTESQRRDSHMPPTEQFTEAQELPGASPSRKVIPGSFEMEVEDDVDRESIVPDSDLRTDELDVEAAPPKSTITLVESKVIRSQSQMSMASTSSSQSQAPGGFFGQASKLVNSVLGTSKKGKTEVKSLQLAAAAAKKQQEEQEKKAVRLKEMENRRQQALQRKAEEEKAKALEQERKLKEEAERRKREREEHTDKRPLKGMHGKKEDDNTKKRKLTVDDEKKAETKKSNLKSLKPATSKSILKPALKQPTALTSSAVFNASYQPQASTSKIPEAKSSKPSTLKGKAPQKAIMVDDDDTQPSQLLQSQMAARAKAQLKAAKQEHAIPSEAIELPDINSEYSDSEDEDRQRTFDPPGWAQSPELRLALQQQQEINPDDIFGPIRPLRMEEIFRTRANKFRARTSSANWTGTDRLTVEEELEYVRRMGYK